MKKAGIFGASYLGVAAVWLGGHFGPGFATGAFSVTYYVKYGWIGLLMPLLAMLVTGGVSNFRNPLCSKKAFTFGLESVGPHITCS